MTLTKLSLATFLAGVAAGRAGATAARELFAVLREFDAQGVRLIWIETPPDSAEWEGVRDRLRRAAA